ncbi:MAG: hypothetical protein K0S70_146 [Microbacterium sp.]|jgi:hypothetical protein|nr:hypothetical protein [Microbacterium sp.]
MGAQRDAKRSAGARVATVARRQARAAKAPAPVSLQRLARDLGAEYRGGAL